MSSPCCLCEQLLNTRNINQILQLLFSILVNCDHQTTRQYAVDLFTDLLQCHPHVQQSLLKSVSQRMLCYLWAAHFG